MFNDYIFFHKIYLWAEIISALISWCYWSRLKNTYWIYFIFFLNVICLQEILVFINFLYFKKNLQNYYAYFGIPVQYIFFYWLYGLKSLKNKNIFITCVLLYLISFIPLELYGKKIKTLYSVNIDIGNILLIFLVVLEFLKQIKSDDILRFWENKMFYINAGVILFYVGTYPFTAFYTELRKEPYTFLWNAYYLYFLISSSLMYLLFGASFIWGKVKT